jgi:hypothetical protein
MPRFKSKWSNLIQEVGSVSIDIFEQLFHEYVVSRIKQTNNNEAVDVSLIRLLCNWLENSTNKKDIVDSKINKKQLVINEYIKLKPVANTPEYKIMVEKIIDDLHNTNQIKKVSSYFKTFYRLKSCISKNK